MATLSPINYTLKLKHKLCHSQHHATLPSKSLSFLHPFGHAAPHRRPMITISHVKLSDAVGEEFKDVVDDAFFDDVEEGKISDEDDDDDDKESSIDLLVRFLQSMFKKVSKRAKKASRSVLPAAISPLLVSFAVDGILLLASLSIIKALLEVVCTLGGTVFVAILLLRVFWSGVSYFQSSGNDLYGGGSSFGTAQSAS